MSELAGLFLVNDLKSHGVDCCNTFCLIDDIEIYSVYRPVNSRAISYRIKYTPTNIDPNSEEFLTNLTAYRNPVRGKLTMGFYWKLKDISSLKELLNITRRHFNTDVLSKNEYRSRREMSNELSARNMVHHDIVDDDITYRIYDLHHKESLQLSEYGDYKVDSKLYFKFKILQNNEEIYHLDFSDYSEAIDTPYLDYMIAIDHIRSYLADQTNIEAIIARRSV